MSVILRPFRRDDETVARAAHRSFADVGMPFLLHFKPDMEWATWLERIADVREGKNMRDREVRGAFLAAESDEHLVGRVSLRFGLNEFLALRGGHIGYAVIRDFRRRGYATEMLRSALVLIHDDGVDPVLIICDDDNVASARVIEHCGGVLESIVADEEGPFRRYWITTDS